MLIHQKVDSTWNWRLPWSSYKEGFGNPLSNYWLGLECMHQLTNSGSYQLKVELQKQSTSVWYTDLYSYFSIGNEGDKYQLKVNGHSGNAGNSLGECTACENYQQHNKMKFTTYDQDNDEFSGGNCADFFNGGNWYNECRCLCITCSSEFASYFLSTLKSARMSIKPV
jgi:ficolin